MDNKGMFIFIIALSVIWAIVAYLIAISDINPWLKFWLLK